MKVSCKYILNVFEDVPHCIFCDSSHGNCLTNGKRGDKYQDVELENTGRARILETGPNIVVDANFLLFALGQFCTYKTTSTLG